MIGAFVELTARSFRNRILLRLRRLRQPRYAVGGLFGAGYFAWLLFRNRRAANVLAMAGLTDFRLDLIAVAVFAMMLLAWALPADSGGLTFAEAEITMLFPAPLRRRDLLLYKIIRSQPQLLLSTAAVAILGGMPGRFLGVWLAFTALNVYLILVALGRARLRLMRIGFVPRLVGVAAIAIGVVNAAFRLNAVLMPKHLPTPQAVATVGHAFFQQPFLRALLFVPRLFAMTVFPTSMRALAISGGALIALSVVFFFLAAALNVSFEEASIARSQRRHAMRERMIQQRTGGFVRFPRLRSPFPLRENGRPEVAILWKNVIATLRMSLGTIIALGFVFIVIAFINVLIRDATPRVMSMMFLMLAAMLPILGPNLFAQDLRLDLTRLEILKSYPLSGDLVVAAEIAAPLAVISAFEIAALLGFLATSTFRAGGMLSFVNTTQAIVCALIVAVPFCALQLLLRNAAPVLFPAWMTRSKEEGRGFAVGGQRLLTMVGSLAVLSILLIPAAIVFLPCVLIASHYLQGSPIAYALMTVPAATVLSGEVWLGIRLLGGRYDALDISVEMDSVSV